MACSGTALLFTLLPVIGHQQGRVGLIAVPREPATVTSEWPLAGESRKNSRD
jgi:hypothetical protein